MARIHADTDRLRADTARILALGADFARRAERRELRADRVTVGYRVEAPRRLPFSFRARAEPLARPIRGKGWMVRPYRHADVPWLQQASVTITRAGRVLLHAEWQPFIRELRVSDDGDDEVLLDEEDDATKLADEIERYFAVRGRRPGVSELTV